MKKGRAQAGQAITEFALIVPMAFVLVLGTFDLSVMGTDTGLAVAAARHGARLAAEVGGSNNNPASCNGTLPAGTTTLSQDQLIVNSVLAVTNNMSYMGGKGAGFAPKGRPESITIYRPTSADGTLTATDHRDVYTYANSFAAPISGPTAYALRERCQGPLPNDSEIGVQLVWTYVPANGIPGPSFTNTQYAVERMALCGTDNCNPAP